MRIPALTEEEIQRRMQAKKERDAVEAERHAEWQRRYDAKHRAAQKIMVAIQYDYFEKFPVCSDWGTPPCPAVLAKALFPLLLDFGKTLDGDMDENWGTMSEAQHHAFCERFSERHDLTAAQKREAYDAAAFLMDKALSGDLKEQDLNHVRDPFLGNLTLHFVHALTKALAGEIALNPAKSEEADDSSTPTKGKRQAPVDASVPDTFCFDDLNKQITINGIAYPPIDDSRSYRIFKLVAEARGDGVSRKTIVETVRGLSSRNGVANKRKKLPSALQYCLVGVPGREGGYRYRSPKKKR
jgi:hypothetical protein